MPRPRLVGMKIGFKTSQTNVDWPTLAATWELADERPILDSGWLFDHFVALGEGGGGSHEAFTMLAALAARTTRLQLGHLVLSNTYRHPALTAKSAATVDHIAPGRFVLGLGAGWHEGEHGGRPAAARRARLSGFRLPDALSVRLRATRPRTPLICTPVICERC